MYGNKLLTPNVWQMFCEIFEESGFEVYESRESFIEYVQMGQQKNAEDRRLAVGELTKIMRDRYWRVEEMGDAERTQSFISMLEASVIRSYRVLIIIQTKKLKPIFLVFGLEFYYEIVNMKL